MKIKIRNKIERSSILDCLIYTVNTSTKWKTDKVISNMINEYHAETKILILKNSNNSNNNNSNKHKTTEYLIIRINASSSTSNEIGAIHKEKISKYKKSLWGLFWIFLIFCRPEGPVELNRLYGIN